MISKFQLIRNIGVFDSVQGSQETKLAKLTLIYAENARGKTTLSAILNSLKTGEPYPIIERGRLGSSHLPHVIIERTGSAPPAIFQNNSWTRNIPNILIFDDMFIDQNVSSGLKVDAGHRQNLHEVVVGAQGVDLARKLDELAVKIDKHNAELRRKADLIPRETIGRLTVDEFCELKDQPEIDEAIMAEERRHNALKNAEEVRAKSFFSEISLPSIDVDNITKILSKSLSDLDSRALSKIKEHLNKIGEGGENWIEQGMHRIYEDQSKELICPFCVQNLKNSSLIELYKVYFSEAYSDLMHDIDNSIAIIKKDFGGDAIAGFQEKIMKMENLYHFWAPMCEMPKIEIDSAEMVKAWQEARKVILDKLTRKKASPLDRIELDKEGREKVKAWQDYADSVEGNTRELLKMNTAIRHIKEEASSGNIEEVIRKLDRLNATKRRYSPDIVPLCDDHIKEKEEKKQTEKEKTDTRALLDKHRNTIFPKYQDSINKYLDKFNASFRVDRVVPTNPRGRASCSYCFLINNIPVQLETEDASQTAPSYKNTLSSGDRSTLALAFFFASLDQESDLSQQVIIIDDPVTSLDDYREISTTQEIQSLIGRTAQIIVLSHDKHFLCKIWENSDEGNTATLEIKRAVSGSTIKKWDIHPDTLTDYDVRHRKLREYNEKNVGDLGEIARNIRFVLEGYCRTSWPEHCPPGFQLGNFKEEIRRSLSSQKPILNSDIYQEFFNLIDYAHKFHHDTNSAAWQEEIRNIKDAELQGFVRRTLEFTKHR